MVFVVSLLDYSFAYYVRRNCAWLDWILLVTVGNYLYYRIFYKVFWISFIIQNPLNGFYHFSYVYSKYETILPTGNFQWYALMLAPSGGKKYKKQQSINLANTK